MLHVTQQSIDTLSTAELGLHALQASWSAITSRSVSGQ